MENLNSIRRRMEFMWFNINITKIFALRDVPHSLFYQLEHGKERDDDLHTFFLGKHPSFFVARKLAEACFERLCHASGKACHHFFDRNDFSHGCFWKNYFFRKRTQNFAHRSAHLRRRKPLVWSEHRRHLRTPRALKDDLLPIPLADLLRESAEKLVHREAALQVVNVAFFLVA